jgi:hypothetical protein
MQAPECIQIGFATLKDEFEYSFLCQQRDQGISAEHDIRLSHCGGALLQSLEFVQIHNGKSLDCLVENFIYCLIGYHGYSNKDCMIFPATSEGDTL